MLSIPYLTHQLLAVWLRALTLGCCEASEFQADRGDTLAGTFFLTVAAGMTAVAAER